VSNVNQKITLDNDLEKEGGSAWQQAAVKGLKSEVAKKEKERERKREREEEEREKVAYY